MHPVEPRTFGTLLSDSFAVLKRNSGIISKAICFFWLLPLIPVLLTIVPLIQQWPKDLALERMDENTISPQLAGLLLSVFFTTFIFSLIAAAGYIVMVSIAVCDREDESLRLREHLSPILKRNLWWVIAIFLCALIAGEIASVPFKVEAQTLGGMPYLLFSSILSAVIGMKMYLTIPSLVLEDRGPLRAVERSWKLTNGHFWQTMGRYFAVTMLSAIAVMVPFMFGLVAMSVMIKGSGASNVFEGMQDLGTLMTVFLIFLPTLIMIMLVLVIEPIYRSELYYDLRTRKGEFEIQPS